jgi:hypothetical protein
VGGDGRRPDGQLAFVTRSISVKRVKMMGRVMFLIRAARTAMAASGHVGVPGRPPPEPPRATAVTITAQPLMVNVLTRPYD